MSELVRRLRALALGATELGGISAGAPIMREAADALEQAEEKIALLNRTIETLVKESTAHALRDDQVREIT